MRSPKDLRFQQEDFQAKYSASVLSQNLIKCGDLEYSTLMPSGQVLPKKEQLIVQRQDIQYLLKRVDNLVYLNSYPLLIAPPSGPGKASNIYQIIKNSQKPFETVYKIIQLISLELFEKFGEPGDLLQFIRKLKDSSESAQIFPFYAHSDFTLIKNKQLQLHFQKLWYSFNDKLAIQEIENADFNYIHV